MSYLRNGGAFLSTGYEIYLYHYIITFWKLHIHHFFIILEKNSAIHTGLRSCLPRGVDLRRDAHVHSNLFSLLASMILKVFEVLEWHDFATRAWFLFPADCEAARNHWRRKILETFNVRTLHQQRFWKFWIFDCESGQDALASLVRTKQTICLSSNIVKITLWARLLSFQSYGGVAWIAKNNDLTNASVNCLRGRERTPMDSTAYWISQ